MRYLAILGLCLLALTILGCSETQQSVTPPAKESASSGEANPASDNPTEAGTGPESHKANENGGLKLDVDIGRRGVHVGAEGPDKKSGGPDEKSGVQVDVGPKGQVDIDLGENTSEESDDSSP